jgi:hypothetical protein
MEEERMLMTKMEYSFVLKEKPPIRKRRQL